MKKCADVYHHICDNIDQELDSPECREIRKHMESCPDCRAYLDSMKKTVALYRSLPAPHVPRTVHSRLLRALASGQASRKRPRKTSRRAR